MKWGLSYIKRKLWRRFKNILPILGEAFASPSIKHALMDHEMRMLKEDIRQRTPDNPALLGFKVYSQIDEDGIIENIFTRIGEGEKSFVELGCGNGTENNSHYLALKGWKGVWVDGSEDNIRAIANQIPLDSPSLLVEQMFLTRDNIGQAMGGWIARLGDQLDMLSLDIDGNDSKILDEILKIVQPRLLVLEYNGKYPPPLKLSVAYNPSHQWEGDDYYGSSLQVYVDQLKAHYRLVSCGLSGANAYFVRNDLAAHFVEYSVEALYMRPRHHLIQYRVGGNASLKFLRHILLAV